MADDVSAYATHTFIADVHNNSWSNVYGFVPAGARVLDVGCSTGNLGAALIEGKGCAVTGVDVNAADIDVAKKQLTEAYVMDVSRDASAAILGTFDVIIFADVLEHLADPRETLRSIHPLLNSGGTIVYSIPNMSHASVRMDLLKGDFPYTETGILDKTHFHFYDRHEIASVLTDGGFSIQEEDPVIVEYPAVWLIDRLAQSGLTPDARFFDMLEASGSNVFQYVGTAVAAASIPDADAPARQRPMPTLEIVQLVESLKEENAALRSRLDELHHRIRSAKRHPIAFLRRWVTQRLTGRRKS